MNHRKRSCSATFGMPTRWLVAASRDCRPHPPVIGIIAPGSANRSRLKQCAIGLNACGAHRPCWPRRTRTRDAERHGGEIARTVRIAPECAGQLAGIAGKAGVGPEVLLLAAFQTILFRWTGQSDVCIGVQATTRPDAARGLVGCFTTILPLRTNLGENPTFVDLLGRTRNSVADALLHRHISFEKLVEELKPDRIPGTNPLFQTQFSYLDQPSGGDALEGLTWTHEHSQRGSWWLDFSLVMEERADGLFAHFRASRDLYDDAAVDRFAAHWQTLLASIAAGPEARISDFPILPPQELEQVVRVFNASDGEFPHNRCVHELVDDQVLRTPDAVAFVCRGQALTYRELNEQRESLGPLSPFASRGPDTLIGLCVERSLDMAVAMLGILKSGEAYVPLDPDFPADRLDFYVRDSKMPLVVVHQHLLGRLPVSGFRAVCLDADRSAIDSQPASNPESTSKPMDLVYVLYTSGSTGRPNGVAVEHRSLCNLLWSFRREPGLGGLDTILSITTLSFDIHTVEIWLPMIVGARSVIATSEDKKDGQRLIDLLDRHRITVMQSTPATWRLLLTVGWKGKPDLKLLTGGEALTTELAQHLLGRGAEVWNVYGPTETTVWSIIHRVTQRDATVFIGRPVLNTQVYVLDPQRRPAPIGCTGEIWIAGVGLSRGYFGRDELTAARFVPDPFAGGDARMYKTGDFGRIHPNGVLECLGRIDHQVKVRGFRIEIKEIERALEEYKGIAEAVVVAKTDDGSAALHAYYRGDEGGQPAPADLRRFLQGRLPDYMVPSTFTVLTEFPQTPNAKVDRNALSRRRISIRCGRGSRNSLRPPPTRRRALAAIWEDLFGVKPISVLDNFHDLGGHSLRAAVLMSRIETKLNHRLPIELLFKRPTVRGLAEAIQQNLELGAEVMAPLQTGGSLPPLFLIAGVGGHVFQFHRFAHLLGPEYVAYGMKAIGVDGSEPPLDCFEAIAQRYVGEILRECPDGPYLLGGYSIGGRIALEVALQLQALGKQVPKLLVFDEFAPGWPKPLPPLQWFQAHLKRFWNHPHKISFVKERLRSVLGHLTGRRAGLIATDGLDIAPRRVLAAVESALIRGNRRLPARPTV